MNRSGWLEIRRPGRRRVSGWSRRRGPASAHRLTPGSLDFSFSGRPDKGTLDAAWGKLMEMPPPADMLMDGKRMFWGGFVPIVQPEA